VADHPEFRRPASDRRPDGAAPASARPPVGGVPRTINDAGSAIHDRRDGAPDSLAVALVHDPDHPDAPRVIASGKGWVAEQILALAFETGIRVREDSDLAQMLAAMDLDTELPLEAYTAVSEILAYVYRVNGRLAPAAGDGAPQQEEAGEREREREREYGRAGTAAEQEPRP
jgi:flagellar biosynthesis protein